MNDFDRYQLLDFIEYTKQAISPKEIPQDLIIRVLRALSEEAIKQHERQRDKKD